MTTKSRPATRSPKKVRPPSARLAREPELPFRPQKLPKPGIESYLSPLPRYRASQYRPAAKLKGQVALITGGDSGIGRAVALLFAREGADVAITCLPAERSDAEKIQGEIKKLKRRCFIMEGDLTSEFFCRDVIERTVKEFGKLDVLVSNAAYQNRKKDIADISSDEWDRTFKTNIYPYFHLVKAAMPHLKAGASIIATSSETAALGPEDLLDYASTKGAINTFTKSLAQMLIGKGIRVNAVAPGPVWTPLNPADTGSTPHDMAHFGHKQPIERPAQPEELAPAYVFLASHADSSYVSGAIIPVTGGLPIAS